MVQEDFAEPGKQADPGHVRNGCRWSTDLPRRTPRRFLVPVGRHAQRTNIVSRTCSRPPGISGHRGEGASLASDTGRSGRRREWPPLAGDTGINGRRSGGLPLGDNVRWRIGGIGGQGQRGREKQRERGHGARVEADRRSDPGTTAGALSVLQAGAGRGSTYGQSAAASANSHACPPLSRRRYTHRCRAVCTQRLCLSTKEADTWKFYVQSDKTSTLARHGKLDAAAES